MKLSKSGYICAVQCPKMLWLKQNRPDEFDDSVRNETVLETGTKVGELARGLFGRYELIPYEGDPGSMIRKTEECLERGTEVICEASFSFGGLFCSIDILKNLGDSRVEIYEVKSSSSVRSIYLADIAFQRYILKSLGFIVTRVCIVHIDPDYVRFGELEPDRLFKTEDLTEQLEGSEEKVERDIAFLEKYLLLPDDPDDDIGEQCFKPYECGFFRYCTRMLPSPNVFDISSMRKSKQFEYYRKGLFSFESLLRCAKLGKKFQQQVRAEVYSEPPIIDRDAIREFLRGFTYPLYFLDFESFQPAVPLFDNSRPYQAIPFQYSLDWYENEGGELKHKEYLAPPYGDPRRELAERLCRDIPRDVCTVAYNMSFEKERIRELAELFPDLSEHLMNIRDGIVDLMIPFRERSYYTREMAGSYSIKHVLPALFPDDPDLDYRNLEGVHNGAEASATYEAMRGMTPEDLEKSRREMLRYCGLDTLAMVKIYDRLKSL